MEENYVRLNTTEKERYKLFPLPLFFYGIIHFQQFFPTLRLKKKKQKRAFRKKVSREGREIYWTQFVEKRQSKKKKYLSTEKATQQRVTVILSI